MFVYMYQKHYYLSTNNTCTFHLHPNSDNTFSFGPEKIDVLTVCQVTNSDTVHRGVLDCNELNQQKLHRGQTDRKPVNHNGSHISKPMILTDLLSFANKSNNTVLKRLLKVRDK